jgi:hypothetical protein
MDEVNCRQGVYPKKQLENAPAIVGGEKGLIPFVKGSEVTKEGTVLLDGDTENDSNKKRKTPSNSVRL